MRRTIVTGCLIALSVAASACQRAPAPPPRKVLRIIVFPGFARVATSLAQALKTALPGVDVEMRQRVQPVEDVKALQRGDADVAFAFADMAYLAFVGQLEPNGTRFDRLRGIAVLQRDAVHLLVRGNSGIRDVAGLRGKRVSVQLTGSSSALTTQTVLKTFGVEVHQVPTKPSVAEQVENLLEGSLDAMFIVGRYPGPSVSNAIGAGARLVPIEGPAVDRLRREHPFFHPLVIPQGVYPGAPRVRTISIDRVLICRSGLDEDLVYHLTKAFFEILPDVSLSEVQLQYMNVEQAPATPIPLHEGAARFYSEKEWAR